MTVSEITTIISVCGTILSAVLAIISQIWTTRITAQSTERIASLELYKPRLCDALTNFSVAYARMPRSGVSVYSENESEYWNAQVSAYQGLLSAGYQLVALVPDAALHTEMTALMDMLITTAYTTYPKTDEMFRNIIDLAAPYISAAKPVKSCKQKRSDN